MLEMGIASQEERVRLGALKHLNDPDFEQMWVRLLSKAKDMCRLSGGQVAHKFDFSLYHDPSSGQVKIVRIWYEMELTKKGLEWTEAHGCTAQFDWTSDNQMIVPSFVQPMWGER